MTSDHRHALCSARATWEVAKIILIFGEACLEDALTLIYGLASHSESEAFHFHN